jgi:hypothetical protein
LDPKDPSSLIVKVVRKDEKKRFALPFAPVRDGNREKDGRILTYPKGGPLGMLEGIVSDLVKPKGRRHLEELYGSNEGVLSVARVIIAYIASIDAKVCARTVRLLEEDLLGRCLTHPLEKGLELLKEHFEWIITHGSLSLDILSKISIRTLRRGGYSSFREGYLSELKRSREAQKPNSDSSKGPDVNQNPNTMETDDNC